MILQQLCSMLEVAGCLHDGRLSYRLEHNWSGGQQQDNQHIPTGVTSLHTASRPLPQVASVTDGAEKIASA